MSSFYKVFKEVIKHKCSHCGVEETNLFMCKRCRLVCYCGVTCQTNAWASHKETCYRVYDETEGAFAVLVQTIKRHISCDDLLMDKMITRQRDTGGLLHINLREENLATLRSSNDIRVHDVRPRQDIQQMIIDSIHSGNSVVVFFMLNDGFGSGQIQNSVVKLSKQVQQST